MSLIPCQECKNQISTDAKVCPQCGANVEKPKQPSFFKFALLTFGLLVIFKACSNGEEKTKSEAPPDPLAAVRFQKVAVILNSLKSSLRDPSSFALESALANDDASVVCITYRAKNGFGGTNFENIVVSSKGTSRASKDWNQLCAGKMLHDLKSARHAIK